MYLITFPIPYTNASQLVFCMTDPRSAGYSGPVQMETELEAPNLCDSSWMAATSDRVVGQDPDCSHRYRLFKNAEACEEEGFQVIGPMPVVTYRWSNEFYNLPRKCVAAY